MDRRTSRPGVLRSLIEHGVLAAGATVERAGTARWSQAEFNYVLSLDYHPVTLGLWISDRRFEKLKEAGYGGVRVKIQPAAANFPARLAQALLIGRDLGRADLENRARETLVRAPDTNFYGKRISALEGARRSLVEYAKVITTEVAI